jgi:hypothetical protein
MRVQPYLFLEGRCSFSVPEIPEHSRVRIGKIRIPRKSSVLIKFFNTQLLTIPPALFPPGHMSFLKRTEHRYGTLPCNRQA